MNFLVPLEYYGPLFYNLILVIMIGVWIQSNSTELTSESNLKSKQALGNVLLGFLILYIGLRPTSGRYFIDMSVYARTFNYYKNGGDIFVDKDPVFEYFTKICSYFLSESLYFLACAILFMMPLYWGCKKIFKEYWFYAFLITLGTFTFWGNATNGIRNGIAISIAFMGVAYYKQRTLSIALIILSILFHKSMIIIAGAFLVAHLIKNPKLTIYGWIACVPISYAVGGFFENFFLGLGIISDDRLSLYFADEANKEGDTYVAGFRFDFILYSALAVASIYYFVIIRKYRETFYLLLSNTFLIANGFWVLIVRAQFSNRFAALSWAFMGVIMIYPLLKHHVVKSQHQWIAGLSLVLFSFAYVLLFILGR